MCRLRVFVLVVGATVVLGLLAGCGSSAKPHTAPPSVVGRSYSSTAVTGHAMPAGAKVTLRFASDGKVSANAGCNTMSGDFFVQRGRLVTGQLAVTEIGCPPGPLQAQDAWLAGVLASRPQLVQTDTKLVLTSGATTIEFAQT